MKAQKVVLISFVTIILGGLVLGLFHDFTWEEAFSVKSEYVLNSDITQLERDRFTKGHERGMYFNGSKLVSMTQLNDDGLKIQKDDGCIACHEKR